MVSGLEKPADCVGGAGGRVRGALIPNPRRDKPGGSLHSPHAVIPLVSAMNAVSRLISSSLNTVSLWPARIKSVGRSL